MGDCLTLTTRKMEGGAEIGTNRKDKGGAHLAAASLSAMVVAAPLPGQRSPGGTGSGMEVAF